MSCRNRLFFLVLLTISFNAYVECQSNNAIDINEISKNFDIDKLKENLPPGVKIPDSLQNVKLPTIDDVKKVAKEKCTKVSGGDAAYLAIEKGSEDLTNCISGLVNVAALQEEIEEAQPNGELDTVFNKYCRKRDIAIECMTNFTTLLEPCLEPKEIEGKRTFVKIFKNLLNFVCYKDGDQIALFIAEKGPECFDERKDDLIHCMNKTFSDYLPSEKDIESKTVPTELPELVMGQSQCRDMDLLKVCVVQSLEKCEESTPANLVESMFKFVRNETPCVNFNSTIPPRSNERNPNKAPSSTVSSVLIASLLAFITVRTIAA